MFILNPSLVQARKQLGISLIELVMFIVIVGVGVAGILSVMNVTTRHSADPMIRKQAVAIAESLLEEIQLQAFTFCDPDDTQAERAINASDCTVVEALGPELAQGEGRYTAPFFDNVNDYHGFSMNSVRDITNNPVGLDAYSANVQITHAGASFGLPAEDALQINITVGSGNDTVTLTGYRFRYAPNAL